MKLIPFYLFIALFIGFFAIYVFKNDYFVILKNKKCANGTLNCQNMN